MAEHPNAELFRKGYTAFQQGELENRRSRSWLTTSSGMFPGTTTCPGSTTGWTTTISSVPRASS